MKLQFSNESVGLKTLAVLLIVAYLFSLSIRYIWVGEVKNTASFHWNNALMINTNDGYYFAEGARDILSAHHQANDLSPITEPISLLTASLSHVIPVSFETLILYMSAFIGSLIVIPLILIGRTLGQTTMGFIAALIASIANSYYNRTMTGYYDTDMLNIVLPLFALYFILLALSDQRNRLLLPITLAFATYQWWYPQSYALNTALLVTTFLYAVIFERTNHYLYKISLFIIIGVLSLPFLVKIGIALAVFAFFHFFPQQDRKWFWPVFGGVILLYFAAGGIDPIWNFLKSYVMRESVSNDDAGLYFYNVAQTVREAGHIPFDVFAQRISGHTVTFLAACVGYLLAVIAYRPLLITLPLVGLGFIAMSSGLRFTIYAVAPMAIGFAYLLLLITRPIEKTPLRYAALVLLTGAALYPNYLHVKEYMTPTVFTAQEVAALEQLGKISDEEDYVISWWDFGYPIRYYSDVKTLVDGGKHTGDVNYPASYVLTQPMRNSAYMGRLSVEYTEKGFETNNSNAIIAAMLKTYKADTVDDLMMHLQLHPETLPKPTRDVYLYLPFRMMEILPTVTLFSYLDLKNPDNTLQQPFFYTTQSIQDTGGTLEFGQGISLEKARSVLHLGNQEVPIKHFYQVGYDESNTLQINEQQFASEGLNVVYMASYGRFLLLDDFYLNSAYIQMFVFDRYDKDLFEPVLNNPMCKIYKLKV
ncbi:MAG: peptide transporter [Sulfuricurvum sp.]|jgi:dolichyl-diphosphooligosaccharide--protein glycosyltransferase/undecaprenyl-diphosphooligosaccharide--protein glycosyltransferase|uniref:STT3 domain-containing protein n=1 Tax=Sulfuricurvum sp. TaxID=2025608 RepID=UPI0025D99BCB|nr:STT3 domain-containing protein [Sulfuricurvum sp.]MCK9374080.1 peptide transporter [Sulfuricurvum sp.]